MNYEDRLKLAKQHLESGRQQTQSALELLSRPADDSQLDELHFSRLAVVASIGVRSSEVIEDINCQLGVGEDYLYERSELGG